MAITERLLTPGQEGSEQALQILELLHKTTPAGGVSITDVCALLQMSQTVAKAALKGLYSRGRACTEGYGMGAKWIVKSERISS